MNRSISIRFDDADVERMTRLATADGRTLTGWLRHVARQAAKEKA